jgi:hypothetical protein
MNYIASWGIKDREKNIYKLSKIREMKKRDLNYTKCILDENQRVLVKEERFERNGKVTLKNFLMKAIQKIGKS